MIWWFAVLFFSILAGNQRSFGVCKCNSNDTTHKFDLLPDEFKKAAGSVPMPSFSTDYPSATIEFSINYRTQVSNYIKALIVNLNHQAMDGAERLAKAVRKASQRLRRSIKLIGDDTKPSISLDKDLELLTNHLSTFLGLNPGDEEIKCPMLPDLPEQPIKSQPPTGNRTLSDFMTNYTSVLYFRGNAIYGYITDMYLAGWREARTHYITLQTQFRKQILHGSVQDACRQAVRRVIERTDLVRKNVRSNTWKSFEDVADRVNAISHLE